MSRDAIELTRELIRLKTVNPPGDERPCAEFLAKRLERAGFAVDLIPFGAGRAQLVARIGGSVDRLPLAFTGHLDTVPLGSRPWSVDPFAAELDGDRLFGRGSTDMKSGVAAFVIASIAHADRLGGKSGVLLVITAGEETGCTGAIALAEANNSRLRAGALVVAEPTENKPLAGHKGVLWLEAETHGVTAHGSMPQKGVNAVYKAARAISALEKFRFEIADHSYMGAPTLNVGTVRGGLNINSVPDHATIGIDIRTIPGQRHDETRDRLAQSLGSDANVRTLIDMQGVWTDPGEDWMQSVAAGAKAVTKSESEISAAPYFTDACALTPMLGSPPTVILGPGEMAMAHQTDEFCSTKRITEATEIYSRLIREWCGL